MIVVVGRPTGPEVRAIAATIAARGGRCEVVGTALPGSAGDRVLGQLAASGVGHAAVLRTPAEDLDAPDLELALRYLPDCRVIVLVGEAPLVRVAAEAAGWAGATLIVIAGAPGSGVAPDLPPGNNVVALAAPARDPDGAFAGLVADLAIRLDGGDPLPAAWRATLGATGAQAAGTTAATRGETVSESGASASEAVPASDPAGAREPARRGSDRRSARR